MRYVILGGCNLSIPAGISQYIQRCMHPEQPTESLIEDAGLAANT
jgi:hypothetical protein